MIDQFSLSGLHLYLLVTLAGTGLCLLMGVFIALFFYASHLTKTQVMLRKGYYPPSLDDLADSIVETGGTFVVMAGLILLHPLVLAHIGLIAFRALRHRVATSPVFR